MRKSFARGLAASILAVSSAAFADSSAFLQRLHTFGAATSGINADGTGSGQLIVHSNGNVYGIRDGGGSANAGTFFRMTPAGTVTVLHNFGPSLASGQKQARYPKVLVADTSGDIYIGVSFGGSGTGEEGAGLVKYSPTTGAITGLPPTADNISTGNITALADGADGYIYATGEFGIAAPPNNTTNQSGVIFKILKSSGAQTPLRFFGGVGSDPAEGDTPGSIIRGGDGWFYGHNVLGGGALMPDNYREANGTLWRITANGATFQTLHLFKKSEESANGGTPIAFIKGADGYFYGQTQYGGEDLNPAYQGQGEGVLFRYDLATDAITGIRNRETYDGTVGGGQFRRHPLIESGDYLYTLEEGSVYRVSKDGFHDSLHRFSSDANGHYVRGLARDADGALYVLASLYGANNTGTLSRITVDPASPALALTADPVTVPDGGSTTLTWSGTGTACRAYGGGPYSGQSSSPWPHGSVAASGCVRAVIKSFYTGPMKLNFAIACEANGGTFTVSRSVEKLEATGTPTSAACPGDGGGDPDPDPVGGDPVALTKGSPRAISGADNSTQEFYLDVPAGATDLSFTTSGGSGDLDLYVRLGSRATTNTYDCRPYETGNEETCEFATPTAGRYYVLIHGYDPYAGASLIADYTPASIGGGGGDGDGDGDGSGGDDAGGGGGGGAMSLGLLLLALVRKWTR